MKDSRTNNDELFSAFIHEIKNSLNPVINLASVLKRNAAERLTSDENSYLEIIERNGKKILNIIEEFSFYSRATERQPHQSFSDVAVREVIDNTFTACTGYDKESGFTLVCDIDEDSAVIYTDYELFRRTLTNILMFLIGSDKGQKSLYFSTSSKDKKFYLTASRKKNEFSGQEGDVFEKEKFIDKGFSSGLIIWIQFASQYISRLNGKLSCVQNNEGDIVFLFSVPLEKETNQKDISSEPVVDNELNKSGRNFVMLVVDDDIDNIIPVRAIIENEFKGSGKLYHAENGTSALDLLESIKPDIILLDLTLPDISGFSLVRNIKNLFIKNDIPVIAFTALDIVEDKDRMLRAGFDDVIRKPFNIDMFIQTISRWIN